MIYLNSIFIKILVTFFAGMGAGLGTGFAGMSAAAVISPMLITFLGIDPYMAVGIALASDVLASAVSAVTYKKNKNLDVKNGLIMMAAVLVFTVVGSFVSSIVPSTTMGNFSVFMTLLLGIKFIVKPVMTTKEQMEAVSKRRRIVGSILAGSLVGFICGFVGAGGGMMMLLILTSVLGYELKTAVGTSVFIMTFTALTGAISHFSFGSLPDIPIMIMCIVFTLIFARVAALFANKAKPETLNRATGAVLVILGTAILVFYLFAFLLFEGETLNFKRLFFALENALYVFGVLYYGQQRKAGSRQHHEGAERNEEGTILGRIGGGRYGVVGGGVFKHKEHNEGITYGRHNR